MQSSLKPSPVAARRISAVGPVQDAILEIELDIDRFRQAVEQHFDIAAPPCGLALRDFNICAEDAAQPRVVRAFLGPVDLPARGIDGYSNAPPGEVAALRIATAPLDERLDQGAVEIRAHHPHPFAIAPVKLTVLLIEMDLLRGERAALRNDDPAIASVDVGALDRTVVAAENAHVGPVDVTGFDIHGDAVGKTAIGDDGLAVGAVRIHAMNAAGVELQHEQAAGPGFAAGSSS